MRILLASSLLLLTSTTFLSASEPSPKKAPADSQISLSDFDKGLSVFSFKKGIVKLSKANLKKTEFDLILDLPHGLATNNSKLAPIFTGSAGIIDAGKKPLKDAKEAPAEGYAPALSPKQIIKGHTYYVKCYSGKKFAKIHITDFDAKSETLTFTWAFQPDGTRTFK